jgi:hypothetical protein
VEKQQQMLPVAAKLVMSVLFLPIKLESLATNAQVGEKLLTAARVG